MTFLREKVEVRVVHMWDLDVVEKETTSQDRKG